MRRTQRPTIKSKPDKQKNGTDTGLKYSVLKYTIEPLSNKKHEQIINEIKIKLRFVINYKSSCIYNKKNSRGVKTQWSRGQDLNLRSPGYGPDELPDYSTPQCLYFITPLKIMLLI